MNLIATRPPSEADNMSEGYTVGSRWLDRFNNQEYLCISSTENKGIWKLTTHLPLKNNLKASREPLPSDDKSQGYSINSLWININTQKSYICLVNTETQAVWKQISNDEKIKNNLESLREPTPTDDKSLGYSVNSTWINTINKHDDIKTT